MSGKEIEDFEVRRKFKEALEGGKFMITITRLDKGKLIHHMSRKEFPHVDVLKTLEHFAVRYLKRGE